MNPWIRTDDRLPTQEDAVEYSGDSLVLVRWKPHLDSYPEAIAFDDVNKQCHSHWAKLPPASEGE